ncbi:hypothetical protein GOP56_05820 [Brevibacillus sp. 7WMA2]|uniref:hypothetical protein n=1 Tax=Brevibacillus sp. 7WMA2 TaxID=2683193 RepID=UPI0013A7710F|nr:hypothetical protein [Brevibacillus sp. 7WMA2]QIC04116.1 hypothetical protein GOP56_05820 [Brevibacillus sp. 7WMA2]WPS85959.1 hypothetical protein SMD22_15690 [Brevibacillus halotolerans]
MKLPFLIALIFAWEGILYFSSLLVLLSGSMQRDERFRAHPYPELYIVQINKKTDGISGFSYKQIKDKKMYADMKKSGHAPFERIDGKKFVVKVTPVIIEGREVLKTEPYKIDEEMSSSSEPDITSYFWLENDICYQVSFVKNGVAQYKAIAALIKEKIVDVDKLKPIS